MEQNIQDARSLLLEGLSIDGGHHKQYYMEEALKVLVGEEECKALKEQWNWENGMG